MMGSDEDPEDGHAVFVTIMGAVAVYALFLVSRLDNLGAIPGPCTDRIIQVFCGFQAFLHQRERRRGQIALS